MTQAILSPTDGWNRVAPSHRIGDSQCSAIQNFIARNDKVSKFGGTNPYNQTLLPGSVPWVERYYGKMADGTFMKKAFCFSGNNLYYGDDGAGTLTSCKSGFSSGVFPENCVIQVSGNSVMFFFTGKDFVHYYDGNDGNVWYQSAITAKFQQGLEWLDRMWAFEKNSSVLRYSKAFYPENHTDSTDAGEIVIGSDKDSFIRRIIILGDTLFILKNNGFYYIEGRTPSTFGVRIVTKKYGLGAQRGVCNSGSALVFVNEFDKEIYSFGGSETSIEMMSSEIKFAEILNHNQVENICCIEHDNIFRLSFQHVEATLPGIYNSHEVCFPTTERNSKGLPKWCLTKGANISYYSAWNKYGDKELVTGRGDTGKIMYHNRGKNWDTLPMEIQLRTKDKIYAEGRNCRYNYFTIDASPQQDKTVTVRWFLNSRIKGATSDEVAQALDGEETAIAAMAFATQTRFIDRVTVPLAYGKGNSLAIEIYDNSLGLDMDLYSMLIDYSVGEVVRNNLTGG